MVVRIGMVVCLVLVLAGCVTRGSDVAAANRAVVDMARTDEVLDAVREGVRVAFMVDSSTLDERGERITPYVTPAGRRVVDGLLETELADARRISLIATVTIAEAAVSELVGDRATVLAFGSKNRDNPTLSSVVWPMLIGAVRVDGSWRIDSVEVGVVPADPKRAATPADPMEAERDSAIAAARTIAATLVSFEVEDPQGSLDRWLSVSTGSLAPRLRAIPADELEMRGTKRTDPDTSFAAAIALGPDQAVLLVAVSTKNVNGDGSATPYEHLCWLSLDRDESDTWKASDYQDIDP